MLIQRFASILDNSDVFASNNGLVRQIVECMRLIWPEPCLDYIATLVAKTHHPLVLLLPVSKLALIYGFYRADHSDYIDCSGFIQCFNLKHIEEWESLIFDGLILRNFDYFTLFVENQAKVIFNGCISLIWKLYGTVWEQIYPTLVNNRFEFVTCIFEECSLDLGTMLIH